MRRQRRILICERRKTERGKNGETKNGTLIFGIFGGVLVGVKSKGESCCLLGCSCLLGAGGRLSDSGQHHCVAPFCAFHRDSLALFVRQMILARESLLPTEGRGGGILFVHHLRTCRAGGGVSTPRPNRRHWLMAARPQPAFRVNCRLAEEPCACSVHCAAVIEWRHFSCIGPLNWIVTAAGSQFLESYKKEEVVKDLLRISLA
ncbi:hypothetical protein ACLOJK_001680 [Asimina triloba]